MKYFHQFELGDCFSCMPDGGQIYAKVSKSKVVVVSTTHREYLWEVRTIAPKNTFFPRGKLQRENQNIADSKSL